MPIEIGYGFRWYYVVVAGPICLAPRGALSMRHVHQLTTSALAVLFQHATYDSGNFRAYDFEQLRPAPNGRIPVVQ